MVPPLLALALLGHLPAAVLQPGSSKVPLLLPQGPPGWHEDLPPPHICGALQDGEAPGRQGQRGEPAQVGGEGRSGASLGPRRSAFQPRKP